MRRMHAGAAERLDAELAHLHLSARGSFDDARVVRGRARADAQSAARGLEKASRGHDFEVCGLFVGTKPARVCLATEKKMLITASAVKFAELGGDEALKEEQSYLQPPTTRRYR